MAPTSASGTVVRLGANGSPKVAVTPVWSATRSGSQSTVTVAVPSVTAGRNSGPSTPAAMASTARMAVAASSVETTGVAPSTVLGGNVNGMSIHVPETGTLSTTRSPSTCSRAPVDEWVARRLSGPSCTSHPEGSAIRWTGLIGGAAGPLDIGGVQHDGQRSGHVGAARPS